MANTKRVSDGSVVAYGDVKHTEYARTMKQRAKDHLNATQLETYVEGAQMISDLWANRIIMSDSDLEGIEAVEAGLALLLGPAYADVPDDAYERLMPRVSHLVRMYRQCQAQAA